MAYEPANPVAQGVVIATERRHETPRTADGLALSPDGAWLYLQGHPWVAPDLYRVPTRALRDATLTPDRVAENVEHVGRTVFSDGIEADPQGRVYFTDYEAEAITRRDPDGRLVQVVHDARLSWPDAIAFGPDGSMYATVAQFHLLAAANRGVDRSRPPFPIVRVKGVTAPADAPR